MSLLELPREIRDNIYTHLFEPEANRRIAGDGSTTYTYSHTNLFCVNRQVYHEARRIFLEQNTFVKISTPFPESRYQVADHGVPIVASDLCAEDFSQHGLSVTIAFPLTAAEEQDTFIIHIDDLPKFCETWFYSAADYPDLNGHLTLKLELRDPLSSTPLDSSTPAENKVLKALQERLLYPFDRIKNLLRVDVTGVPKPDDAVVAEFKRLMAIPLGSPLERLILATEHKDAGNAALMANQPLEALEHYRKAWEALFIVVNGKSREIHGERYFETFLTGPPFDGQHGSMVSVVLRVRLVANTLLAYLKLQDWETVVHIGMRTINIMRGGREGLEPDEEAANGWVAGPEMGKIYYRTALAFKEMDDKYEARHLLKVAVLFLPNEQKVRELIRECALRLG